MTIKEIYRAVRLPILALLSVLLIVLVVRHFALIRIAIGGIPEFAKRHNSDISNRKLIQFGWQTPYIQEMPAVLPTAQRLPFNGVVLDAQSERDGRGLAWALVSNDSIPQREFDTIRDSLEGMDWGHLSENFLRLNLHDEDGIDWYADNVALLANVEAWARLAHDLGFRGLLIDTEQYGGVSIFDRATQPLHNDHSADDYADQAYLQGQAFMQALNRGYPGLTVIFTFGPSAEYFMPSQYGLLYPFIDGMISAADEQTVLVDGFEGSYSFKEEARFAIARSLIANYSHHENANDPNRYESVMQAGFGLWLDSGCGETGLISDTCVYSPESFSQAVKFASQYSDGYVWVYSERVNWYTGDGFPVLWEGVLPTLDYLREN